MADLARRVGRRIDRLDQRPRHALPERDDEAEPGRYFEHHARLALPPGHDLGALAAADHTARLLACAVPPVAAGYQYQLR